jgi:GT2 family glycosyltransferase
MLVDVVVATYNRPDGLRRCLAALSEQTYPDFGVIVVDDASPAPAVQVAREFTSLLPRLQVVRVEENRGPAHARNTGVAASEADFICFIDDDVDASAELVARHFAALAEAGPQHVSIGPLLAPRDWRPTPWNRWEAATLQVEYDRMERGLYQPTFRQFFTGNAMLARRDFLEAGGFNEQFTRAEDVELGMRLDRAGCRFLFTPGAAAWHYAERSLASWRAIPGQYGRFDVEMDRLHPELRWLENIRREASARHIVKRSLAFALKQVRAEAVAAGALIRAGWALDRLGAHRPGHVALSAAFNLEYARFSRAHGNDTGRDCAITAPR